MTTNEQRASLRVLVVGNTGSGKTTLAREIANRLGLPHVELDELFWGPSWIANPEEHFRESVRAALSGGRWVACGNYHKKLQDLTWRHADVIVWLDLPRNVSLLQLIQRTLRRIVRRQALWHGNRETLRNVFFSRESLLVWWWKVQGMEPGRTLERLSTAPQAKVIRLTSKREIGEWLESLDYSVDTLP